MENDLGTYRGQPITSELIGELSAKFESDWDESEITVEPTRYGKALQALQALELPVDEIEALERRAKYERKPLQFFIRSILQGELTG
ncbi:MAG: hypothetical protein LBJ91_07695 [Clostridiales Family XIII bacterium]|nr:hypothetical protein [Clostridiales Family XIII bacterium]